MLWIVSGIPIISRSERIRFLPAIICVRSAECQLFVDDRLPLLHRQDAKAAKIYYRYSHFAPPSTVYRLPSTVYRLPPTIYRQFRTTFLWH